MTIRLRAFGRTSAPAVGIVLFPGPKFVSPYYRDGLQSTY